MSIRLYLLLFLVLHAYASVCGGNCPVGDCPTCPCGSKKDIISLTTYCPLKPWDQSCCKCIISHSSKGNKHYMEMYEKWFFIGVLPVDE